MSENKMSVLSKQDLLGDHNLGKLDFCEHYIFEKQHKIQFQISVHSGKNIVDYIHSNLQGPFSIPSKGSSYCLLSFINDYSRNAWIYFLNDVFLNFKQWKALIENQTSKKVNRLRTHNGTKFCGGEFDEFCKDEGFVRYHIVDTLHNKMGQLNR